MRDLPALTMTEPSRMTTPSLRTPAPSSRVGQARSPSPQSGFAALYVVALLALCTVGFTVIWVVGNDGVGTTAWSILLGTAALAILCLYVEAKRNLLACITFLATTMLIVGVLSIIFGIEGPSPSLTVTVVGSVLAAIGGGLALFIYRERRRPDSPDYPDVLAQLFSQDGIYEVEGIHLAAGVDATYGPEVKVFVQNCLSAKRTVTIELSRDRLLNARAEAHFQGSTTVGLGPGEVGVLTLPVVHGQGGKAVAVYVSATVRGIGGQRVRRREVPALTTRIPTWATLLAAPFGILALGGGLRLAVVARSPAGGPARSIAPRWETIWSHPDAVRGEGADRLPSG